jgi:hypothetical protein
MIAGAERLEDGPVVYVRNNCIAGEQFRDLAEAQDRAVVWCA